MVYLGIQDSIGFHGGGTHQWNVYMSDVQYNYRVGSRQWRMMHSFWFHRESQLTHEKFTNYGDMMYSLSVLFTKLSILLLILRVFCSVKRDVGYWCTWILIVTNTIFYLLFFFIPIFECSPREKIWNKTVPGHCLDVNVLYLASACFNMISDVAMLSVPIYLICHLQISTQRKMGVSAIFATGFL